MKISAVRFRRCQGNHAFKRMLMRAAGDGEADDKGGDNLLSQLQKATEPDCTHTQKYTHTFTHIHTHANTHTHARSNKRTHIYTHTRKHTHTHAHTHAHTFTHLHTCAHTHTGLSTQ